MHMVLYCTCPVTSLAGSFVVAREAARSDRFVLRPDARWVLDRHLVPGERDHLPIQAYVLVEQRRPLQ
jgi:hypothetical protein